MVSRTGLPSSPSTSTANASVYLRPSWKMWPISMPRADTSGPAPSGDGSPSRTSAASMVPSAVKSRPATRPTTCLPLLVRAGDPRRAVDDPRIDEVANTVGQQCPSGRCSPSPGRGSWRSRRRRAWRTRRVERGAEPLVVDLAVAGHADGEQFPLAAGLTDLQQHVLQGVGGGDLAARGRRCWPSPPAWRWSGCRGCRAPWPRAARRTAAVGHRGDDGLDVGGVAGLAGSGRRCPRRPRSRRGTPRTRCRPSPRTPPRR